MKTPRFLLLCLALLSALWMGTAHALPNVDEVQAATQRGDYAGAEKMVREVLAAKPDSARAHYILAEILAHERQFTEAREHASRARALDPSLKFADAARFRDFERLLERQAGATAAPLPATPGTVAAPPRAVPVERSAGSGGVPVWLLVVGAVVFIALAARWMSRRSAAPAAPVLAAGGGYGYGGAPGGYAAPVPPAPVTGGPGLMGVGLAAAGGVAAGMLAERLLHGGAEERSLPRDSGGMAGGLVPGSFDGSDAGSAADELSHRSIDFGTGDGWDSSGGSGGDASSGGGGGDDW